MPRGNAKRSIEGDGIYGEVDCDTKSKFGGQNCSGTISAEDLSVDLNHNIDGKDLELSQVVESERLEQLLDILDEQVEGLNEVQFRGGKGLLANEFTRRARNDKWTCHADIEAELPPVASEPSAALNRQLLLDHYIRHNIRSGDAAHCSCHFDANKSSLIDELDDCYRRACGAHEHETAHWERLTRGRDKSRRINRRGGEAVCYAGDTCPDCFSQQGYSLFIDSLVGRPRRRSESRSKARLARERPAGEHIIDRHGHKSKQTFRTGVRHSGAPRSQLFRANCSSSLVQDPESNLPPQDDQIRSESDEEDIELDSYETGHALERVTDSPYDLGFKSPTSRDQTTCSQFELQSALKSPSPDVNSPEFSGPGRADQFCCCLDCNLRSNYESTFRPGSQSNLSLPSRYSISLQDLNFGPVASATKAERAFDESRSETDLQLASCRFGVWQGSWSLPNNINEQLGSCGSRSLSSSTGGKQQRLAARKMGLSGASRNDEKDFREDKLKEESSTDNTKQSNGPAHLRPGGSDSKPLEGSGAPREHQADLEADSTRRDRSRPSMRAVRDIAKMSVPSLSALQYLPGQLDLGARRTVGNKSAQAAASTSKMATSVRGRPQQAAGGKVAKVISESEEDVKHDEKCLLHRLCLCNCMARGQQVKQLESETLSSSQRPVNKQRGARHLRSLSGAPSPSPTAESISVSSELGASGDEMRPSRRREEYEKQSPSFKSLLRPSHFESHSGRDGDAKSPSQASGSLGSGSLGDLAVSLSTASDSQDLDSRTNLGGQSPTEAASSLAERHHANSAADCSLQEGSARAATGPEKQKTISYRKFLSPHKLFTSSAANTCDDRSGRQKSFLSRSLSRLSGRKRPRSGNHLQADAPIDESVAREGCISPTISISNTSQPDSCNESLNSLDEINLPHNLTSGSLDSGRTRSFLSTAPEVILNRVNCLHNPDPSGARSTRSTSDMTRSKFYSHRSGRLSDRNQNSYSSHQRLPSEGSEAGSDPGGLQGPFSLPGSPRSARRSRSPRLSQSPVPFRSPASESTKIEDGLKVCSTEHFEKHIGNIKENQIEAQKRLFTAWINHFCPGLIRHDLIGELQDGIKLLGLLASLTHDKHLLGQYERLNRDKQSYINRLVVTPSSRLKHLSNVSIAVEYMRKNLAMKLINLNPMDIVSGKVNVILGLCWNIILTFQLEQNLLKHPDDSASNYSSNISDCTSRLSSGLTNEDRAKNISQMVRGSSSLMEEYTSRDLATARKRLLCHINKRFNLKLTNMTSNLVDGDVMLTIVKHLLDESNVKFEEWQRSRDMEGADHDEEKLELCFDLANKYLNVPKLFSAPDLRQQSIDENNPKPLLVYLSMLLSSSRKNCSTEQILELQQVDRSLNSAKSNRNGLPEATTSVPDSIRELDTKDKFSVDKLQSTLMQIKKIDQLIAEEDISKALDAKLVSQFQTLKREADEVETLINWINQADRLFETTQKSSSDLAKSIKEYQDFFSPSNLPQIRTNLNPTLERQYRECLATARQRVLSMEQTMKNWMSYEQARKELKDWLMAAESKLATALRPNQTGQGLAVHMDPVSQHMSRLEDLIDYFELESTEVDDLDSDLPTRLSGSSSSVDQLSRSLSGSLTSLGITSSRLSTFSCSRKASCHRLFDDFELKCHLLAATLNSDQRDALLLGVKELKSRLKYITDVRVPQMVNELKFSISRCELSIKEEQDENSGGEDIATPNGLGWTRADRGRAEVDSAKKLVAALASHQRESSERPTSPDSKRGPKKNRNKKSRAKSDSSATRGKSECDGEKDDSHWSVSYVRRLWAKIVRASSASLSLNIVLLICLAGICMLPLINKDACCELTQAPIASERFTSVHQRPT